MQGLNPEYAALGTILAAALFFFWTQKLRTDITALLVMLALLVPWPHPDSHWHGILTYQEGFSGFGSVAVSMVTAMFVLGAAMVRTGAAERLGGKLFRVCARSEALLQIAILGLSTLFSMFMNDTTVVLVFMPLSLTTSAGFSALMLVMSRSNGWKLMLSNLGRVSPMTTNSNSSARLGSDANAKSNPASQFALTTSP